jgi:cyclic beta-1,2-glucan synthetase
MHRAAIESLFGLKQQAQTLVFEPCLPSHWPQAEISLRRDGRRLRFILTRANPSALAALCQQLGAHILRPGEALRWTALADKSCFVIPLQPGDGGTSRV